MSVRCQRPATNPVLDILSPLALSSHDDCTSQSLWRNVLPDSSSSSLFGAVTSFECPSRNPVFPVAECFVWAGKLAGIVMAVNTSSQYLLKRTIQNPPETFS